MEYPAYRHPLSSYYGDAPEQNPLQTLQQPAAAQLTGYYNPYRDLTATQPEDPYAGMRSRDNVDEYD